MLTVQSRRPSVTVVENMKRLGGSFEKTIAHAWAIADESNRLKLEETFGELFEKFAEHKLVISPEVADKIMGNIDKHIDSGYGTAFDGTYGLPKGSYSRLEEMLEPLNIEIQ